MTVGNPTPGTPARGAADRHIGAEFGLFTRQFLQDPHPVYRRLQAERRVIRLTDGLFVATRYEDCKDILRQPDRFRGLSRRRRSVARLIGRRRVMAPLVKEVMPWTDGADHHRIRRLTQKALAPRVEAAEDRIVATANALIDDVVSSGRMDVVRDFAVPLPTTVLADLIGIPPEGRARIQEWAPSLTLLSEPLLDLRTTTKAGEAGRALRDYLADLVEARRREPRDDLLTALVEAEPSDGAPLTTDQIAANCALLFNNNLTITSLISSGLLVLLRHPDQLARFRDDPSVRPAGIEELLRYEPPVPFLNRVVVQDNEFAGTELKGGDTVALAVCSANRDPQRFPNPDELNLQRPNSHDHLSFGHGPHRCLQPGTSLGQVEGRLALGVLLERLPGLALAVDRPRYAFQITVRRLESLPVTFDPRGPAA